MPRSKDVLRRLQFQHGYPLSDNGLPMKDEKTGLLAAHALAMFAKDAVGAQTSAGLHDVLLAQGVWIWKAGC